MGARDTLGAAVIVAERLPDGIGILLLQVARDAFVQGMQLAAAIAALVAIAIAILALVMLRNVPASSQSPLAGAYTARALNRQMSPAGALPGPP